MKMSQEINEFATAFSKAQAMMKSASKDAQNPFFKSSYATLASVIEALREPFAVNGLSFLQPCRIQEDGSIVVETMILHSSGQYVSGEITGKPVKSDPQAIGSLVSYLKRYGLQAMVGIASADDDGESAMIHEMVNPKKVINQNRQAKKSDLPPKLPEDTLFNKIKSLIGDLTSNFTNHQKLDSILKELNVGSSAEIKVMSDEQKFDMVAFLEHMKEQENIL